MKVIVGLSGGVDSAVSAYLLKQSGYDVLGVFMKNWELDSNSKCSVEDDFAMTKQVCAKLQIKLKIINFSKEYMNKVFNKALDDFHDNKTPNPDVLCNKEIKFNTFLDHALNLGADYVATGHYASIIRKNNLFYLGKAKDSNKDQTYFLYTLTQKKLSHCLFPLAAFTKDQVREIAKTIKLPNCDKKDSTGICFIGEKSFKPFLNSFLLKEPSNIIDTNNNIVGKHDGLMFYTLGQRSGLHIGGVKGYLEKPWYVVDKDIKTKNLIVSQNPNDPLLYKDTLTCYQTNWSTHDISATTNCTCKIRYRQEEQECTIYPQKNSTYNVKFKEPQRAITPGQSIVFYDKNICLGGGLIK